MRYEEILTRSLKIAWRYKWLWLLALFAGESSAGGGGGTGFNNSRFGTGSGSAPPSAPDLAWIPGWIGDRIGLILEIGALIAIVSLILFVLSCVAAGALVRAVADIDEGRQASLGAAVRAGLGTFWRVLGLRLLLVLLALLPFLLMTVVVLAGAAIGGSAGALRALFLDLPLLIAAIIFLLYLSAVGVLALRVCVLGPAGPIAALRDGAGLLHRRFPRVVLVGALLAAVGVGAGLVLGVVLAVLSIGFAGGMADAIAGGRWGDLAGAIGTYLLVVVPVSLVLTSIVGAYYSSVWTVAYRRFDVEGELPAAPPLAA